MRSRLSLEGRVVATVPAYPWLWSQHDEINHHCRRYTRRSLEQSLTAAGLQVIHCSYFNTLLFPLALTQRVTARVTGKLVDDGLTIPAGWLNAALESVFAFERHVVGNVRMPFGLSLLAVANRK